MPLLDSHCHIDLYPDYAALIEEIERTRIVTIAVTNTPSVFAKCQELVVGRRYLRAALGLHPELAHVRHTEMQLFKDLLCQTRFVGEVGLDYVTSDDSIRAVQRRVFVEVLAECARAGDKILTIHSRRAADDVIDAIGAGYPGTAILHWFSGSKKALIKALNFGMYFSVNPAMVRSEAGRKIVASLPWERILTETDGPFVRDQDIPVRPSSVQGVVDYLAADRKVDAQEVARKIFENFQGLIKRS